MAPKVSVTDSIAIHRRRFPGSLVCTTCGRLIASTPAGYAKRNLTSEQVDSYTCANCRADAQVAKETSARFRALVPRVVLKPPLRIVAAAGEPAQRRDESDAAYRRRAERWRQERAASHELLGVVATPELDGACLVDGRHGERSEYASECPQRKPAKLLNTGQGAALQTVQENSRAGSPRQQRRGFGSVSRLAGRRLTVRRQRTSPKQLAALARINAARGKQRGDVA